MHGDAWHGNVRPGLPRQGPKTVDKGGQQCPPFSLGKRLTTFAICASGPSMSLGLARSLMGRCSVIAVSDCFRLAPWADALVSNDSKWWAAHPEALEFKGRKFSCATVDGVERVEFQGPIASGSNSGLLAMHVAVAKLGATRLLLLGFDMRGGHFFGPHVAPLRNTTPSRFEAFKEQFKRYRPRGVDIVNCTASSSLRCYEMASLDESLP